MPRTKDRLIEEAILDLWIGKENDEIPYKDIANELENQGVSKRTVPRYLFTLIKKGALERIERGYKRTFYKPKEDFYQEYLYLKKKTRQSQESLKEISQYVMDSLTKSIAESKPLTEQLYNRVWSEIYSVTKKDEGNTEIFEIATDHIVGQKQLKR